MKKVRLFVWVLLMSAVIFVVFANEVHAADLWCSDWDDAIRESETAKWIIYITEVGIILGMLVSLAVHTLRKRHRQDNKGSAAARKLRD